MAILQRTHTADDRANTGLVGVNREDPENGEALQELAAPHKHRADPDGRRIAEVHQRARACDTVCTDAAWLGSRHRYTFHCLQGHQWQRSASVQRTNATCPDCGRARGGLKQRKVENLQKLHEIAKARGGHCLSVEYEGARRRYEFICASGHQWLAQADDVLSGRWCRLCAISAMRGRPKPAGMMARLGEKRRLPDGLQQLQQRAHDKGGECLSTTYLGGTRKYAFCCQAGHRFEMLASTVFAGRWCRACAFDATRLGLKAAQQAAKARGGLCLSVHYQNNQQPLTWQCDRGHVWSAPLATVRNKGCWCAQCAWMQRITRPDAIANAKYRDAG
jgi:hypothetical protein